MSLWPPTGDVDAASELVSEGPAGWEAEQRDAPSGGFRCGSGGADG